ncbi:MAG: hypothetical protein IJU08_03170 [Bacteroidales bacterium]|nr:hypothetical protein [Bacteroidales bacterium]
MKRLSYLVLFVVALLASACMQDSPAPMNDPDIPLVSVDSETLTRISATLTGSFGKADGIVAYGFELTGTNFDDQPDHIIEVTGLDEDGNFSYTADVKPGAFYSVRSFISDGHNKKYSKELTLKVPQTSVATPSEVTIVGNQLSARIVDDGGRTIREVGFCWSESPDNKTIRLNRMKGAWLGDGTFAAVLPEMEEGHTYYFLAYAENASDAQESFGYSRDPVAYLMSDEVFVTIEDEAFFRYLVSRFDKNQDGKLTSKELKVATDISVSTDQIASVQGIEWMPLLASLDCRGSASGKGRLTTVDVSRNPLLTSLLCDNNRIGALNLSGQPELVTLSCTNNQLSELDLSAAEALSKLDCSGNQIAKLNISRCFRLTELNCSNNKIAELDVSRIPYLRQLLFRSNPLETIDISYCTELETLDGTSCPQLLWVYVSLEQYAKVNATSGYRVDDTATFYPIFVPIQDDTLYENLMSVYDQDGDRRISAREAAYVTRIEVCTDNIKTMAGIEFFYNLEELICRSCQGQVPGQLTELDVSKNRKLTYLDCHGNQLTQLDLSKNQTLRHLQCSDNQLGTLDVSSLVLLGYLNCENNRLSRLDLSRNILLTELYLGQNAITTVDVSRCTALEVLDCSSNGVRTLDVSRLNGLTELKCSHNQLSVLDITRNSRLTTLWCEDNQMTYLNVTNNTRLSDIRCDNITIPDAVFKAYLVSEYDKNGDAEISLAEAWKITRIEVETQQISSMEGIQSFLNLETLVCGAGVNEDGRQSTGGLTSLDLSQNSKLLKLDCRYNRIESLDLSNNLKLQELTCISNQISSLDLSRLADLIYLDCAYNSLNTLDISHNPYLFFLHCQYTGLTELNLSNNPALTDVYCSNNELSELDLSQNTNLARLECAWNSFEELDLSKNVKLERLDIRYNYISSLDVSNNPLLSYLDGRGNEEFYEMTLKTGQTIATLLSDMEIDFIYV